MNSSHFSIHRNVHGIANPECRLSFEVEITDKDVPQLTSATHHMYVLKSSFAYLTANFKLF